eukprot:5439421-Alexandrium_andersonii.AAC.1
MDFPRPCRKFARHCRNGARQWSRARRGRHARSAPRSAHSGTALPSWANKIRPPRKPNVPQEAALRRAPRPGN